MLRPKQKLAILFDDKLSEDNGKMGHGVLRYTDNPVTCVIDYRFKNKRLHDVIKIGQDCPIVSSVSKAAELGAEVLVLGMAPSGGRLPAQLEAEVDAAIENGLCVVNGLHSALNPRYAKLADGQWIWDIRKEPEGLIVAQARASKLDNNRLLMIGTDMAIGKMTAGLEIHRCAKNKGINSRFLATGQIGMTIMGTGIPLDAIRVDYAGGAVEKMVLNAADAELAIIEGQGSLLHPGSTSVLPLIRGSCPTHLVLCHRAGMTALRESGLKIPPLDQVITLHEDLSEACGTFSRAKTIGVVLNTWGMDETAANDEIKKVADQTGLPCTDVVRYDAQIIVDAI
ncbi:MAG: DUF1611 domain-containing protein [Arenicellales bacterium WSBS_2016_MAG_OTU3]